MMEQMQAQLAAIAWSFRAPGDPERKVPRHPIPSLPKLGLNDSLELFLTTFEMQLRGGQIPEDRWKYHLIGQLDNTHRAKLTNYMRRDDVTYDKLVDRLGRLETETRISAGECLFTPEADTSKMKNTTEALGFAHKWAMKIMEGSDDKQEIARAISRARVTSWFNPWLKQYIMVPGVEINTDGELIARVSQWQAILGEDKPVFARKEQRKFIPYSSGGTARKGVTCYMCNKPGHFARDCKSGEKKEASVSTSESDNGGAKSLSVSIVVKRGIRVKCARK